jgi:hypothetical protein
MNEKGASAVPTTWKELPEIPLMPKLPVPAPI